MKKVYFLLFLISIVFSLSNCKSPNQSDDKVDEDTDTSSKKYDYVFDSKDLEEDYVVDYNLKDKPYGTFLNLREVFNSYQLTSKELMNICYRNNDDKLIDVDEIGRVNEIEIDLNDIMEFKPLSKRIYYYLLHDYYLLDNSNISYTYEEYLKKYEYRHYNYGDLYGIYYSIKYCGIYKDYYAIRFNESMNDMILHTLAEEYEELWGCWFEYSCGGANRVVLWRINN